MLRYARREIHQFAHQLKISPLRLRESQITGAQELATLIEPDKNYPYDFVCYHITKYRKANGTTGVSLPGRELLRDLSTLVDDLSRAAPAPAAQATEKLHTIEHLADRLSVSTKTITRWRARGLIGRRYAFPDGKVTLVFQESTVQWFLSANRDLVRRAAAFSQLTPDERSCIVVQARELLANRRMKLHEIAQEISRRTGRATETIRYTLRRHDRHNPQQAVFANDGDPQVNPEHRRIFQAFLAGDSPRDIASALDRKLPEIKAVLREMRCRQIREMPLSYMYSPEFDDPAAERRILNDPVCQSVRIAPSRSSDRAQPYVQDLSGLPVLTRDQERALFRQYNYLKCRAAQLRDALDPMKTPLPIIKRIEGLIARAKQVQSILIQCNLRLVVSIAKRHVGMAPDLFEISSDGNIALMRAVEKFDYTRGNKFSTYATWAVVRNYARTIPEQRYRLKRYQTGSDELLQSAPDHRASEHPHWERRGLRDHIANALGSLDDREREVVRSHFGLATAGKTQTLAEIGNRFGVTKERIRQIERRALIKLRDLIPEFTLDMIPD